MSVTIQGIEFVSPKWLAVSSGAQPVGLIGLDGFPVVVQPPFNLLPLPHYGAQAFGLPDLGTSGLHIGLVLQGLEITQNGVPMVHPARFVSVY